MLSGSGTKFLGCKVGRILNLWKSAASARSALRERMRLSLTVAVSLVEAEAGSAEKLIAEIAYLRVSRANRNATIRALP
jgi:hypothetical protein